MADDPHSGGAGGTAVTENYSIDKRHVSAVNFARLLGGRVPVVLPVPGTPALVVFIEPRVPELGLRTEITADHDAPNTGLHNIFTRIVLREQWRFFEVVVTAPDLFHDAYPVLCAVADRIQLGGMSPADAVRATLARMSSLLRTPDSLSREREVGLFGELLTLGGLIDRLGARTAIEAWRGSLAEEHDFVLPDLDIEVKTTASELRTHWIESLVQLVPKLGRPLWLISHQVTTAGIGVGSTLPDLVDTLSTHIGPGQLQDLFANALSTAGWRHDYRARLTTHWIRRSSSRGYHVAGAFPRLTPDNLRDHGVVIGRIPEIRYRIDLDGFVDRLDVPEVIRIACAFEGWK